MASRAPRSPRSGGSPRSRTDAPARARREAILAAAHTAFSRTGYRRTSMEDIAREGGVSRAALYLHFPNKEAIFRSLAEALHREALARAETALALEGPIQERVQGALEGKSLRFVEILGASPHGAELVETSSRECGDIAAATEQRFVRRLADVLSGAAAAGELDLARAGLSPAAAAELLVQASRGLKQPGTSPALYRRRLADLVRVLLAGLGARAGAPGG